MKPIESDALREVLREHKNNPDLLSFHVRIAGAVVAHRCLLEQLVKQITGYKADVRYNGHRSHSFATENNNPGMYLFFNKPVKLEISKRMQLTKAIDACLFTLGVTNKLNEHDMPGVFALDENSNITEEMPRTNYIVRISEV